MIGTLVVACIACQTPSAPHRSKRALLVAAWDYHSTRWHDLHSPKDIELIKSALLTHFEWSKERGGQIVTLVTRAETKRQSIFDAFRRLFTVDVREGDTFYFHYSGHGYYTPDVDPKLHPDVARWGPINPIIGNGKGGLDTTLLPTDDPQNDANQIRGDELGLLIQEIKTAARGKNVNILVTLDCCHSGGGTRGPLGVLVRGRNYDGPTEYKAIRFTPPDDPKWGIVHPSGYTLISACRDDQEAGEDGAKKCGRFSLALSTSLVRCDKSTSYRQLFDMIDNLIARNYTFGDNSQGSQNPQVEGEVDRAVFGSAAIPEPNYYSILEVGGGSYQLKAGALQGITSGTRINLYPASDNPDSPGSRPFAYGTVGGVGINSSDLSVNGQSPSTSTNLNGAKAVVASVGARSNVLRIDVSALSHAPEGTRIKELLRRLPIIQAISEAGQSCDLVVEYRSAQSRGPNRSERPSYQIRRECNGSLVQPYVNGQAQRIEPGPDAPNTICRCIQNEARFQALIQASNEFVGQSDYVEIRICPCGVKPGPTVSGRTGYVFEGLIPQNKEMKGVLQLQVGAHFAIQYRVHGMWGGQKDPYVALLDLTPDGGAELLWPDPQRHPSPAQWKHREPANSGEIQWRLVQEPGTDSVSVFRVTKPVGREVIKVVATQREVSFSLLFGKGGGRSGGTESPIGALFRDFTQNTPRSGNQPLVSDEPWSTREGSVLVIGP